MKPLKQKLGRINISTHYINAHIETIWKTTVLVLSILLAGWLYFLNLTNFDYPCSVKLASNWLGISGKYQSTQCISPNTTKQSASTQNDTAQDSDTSETESVDQELEYRSQEKAATAVQKPKTELVKTSKFKVQGSKSREPEFSTIQSPKPQEPKELEKQTEPDLSRAESITLQDDLIAGVHSDEGESVNRLSLEFDHTNRDLVLQLLATQKLILVYVNKDKLENYYLKHVNTADISQSSVAAFKGNENFLSNRVISIKDIDLKMSMTRLFIQQQYARGYEPRFRLSKNFDAKVFAFQKANPSITKASIRLAPNGQAYLRRL